MSQDPNNVPGGNPGPAQASPPAPSTISPMPVGNAVVYIPGNITYGWTQISVPYIGGNSISTEPAVPKEKVKEVGCICKRCDNFFDMAESNQDDGTFICWACKNGY
jgi:hypothetical protein